MSFGIFGALSSEYHNTLSDKLTKSDGCQPSSSALLYPDLKTVAYQNRAGIWEGVQNGLEALQTQGQSYVRNEPKTVQADSSQEECTQRPGVSHADAGEDRADRVSVG